MKYRFWYDELGRPVLSQNSKQYAISAYLSAEDQYKDVALPTRGTGPVRAYSYTLYDKIGRIAEVGELLSRESSEPYRHESQVRYSAVANGLVPNGARVQITRTYYDRATFSSSESGLAQDNLRPRVASVTYQDRADGGYERATHYSYDIHGNVESLVQHVREGDRDLRKRIDYEYDLISGNVNMVYYQRGESDQFIHRYGYDGDNRLTEVHTSRDGVIWTKEANYEYYAHGPLARTIIGDSLEIQDHAYTLQGWMKALNGQYFSYALGYFAGDYSGIGTNDNLATPVAEDKDLYNGNIATMASLNPKLSETVWTQQFEYDQLNRIKASASLGLAHADAFRTSYSYDANGNILSLHRYNGQGQAFDALAYHYHNQQNGYKHNTNKLRWVDDNPALSANHEEDLEDQDMDNYHYDELGNLSGDAREEIARIEWNARGKISRVIRTAESAKPDLEFLYDATGNRVAKIVKPKAGNATITYYIRDAAGNVLSVYKKSESGHTAELEEQYIYGGSRVGMVSGAEANNSRTLGLRSYELTDHLGNVRTVISDKPTALGLTEMLAAYDFMPFGFIADKEVEGSYKYGFGGHEKDDEIKGSGNHLSFGDYGYDPRLGRRWQIDPVEIVGLSGYAVYRNNPNFWVDPDGESPISIFAKAVAKTGLKKAAKELIEAQIKKRLSAYMSKGWAKQIGKDALDAIDLATSQAWWEYAIELVPIAGDAYGAAKLGKQGYTVYKITQRFEALATSTSKIAGKAWKRLDINSNLTDKGSDLVSQYTKKFNNQGSHLSENDLVGATRDIFGQGVKKADGSTWNHIGEVQDALDGMGSQLSKLRKQIDAGDFEGDALGAAQSLYKQVQGRKDELQNVLNQAKKAAKEVE